MHTNELVKAKIHYISFPVASPQQVRNINDKSVTSWRGQKSVVSVVSCHFSNSTTTTCCGPVVDLLARNKSAASPSTGKLRGNVCNGFWTFYPVTRLAGSGRIMDQCERPDVGTYGSIVLLILLPARYLRV